MTFQHSIIVYFSFHIVINVGAQINKLVVGCELIVYIVMRIQHTAQLGKYIHIYIYIYIYNFMTIIIIIVKIIKLKYSKSQSSD